MLMGHDRPYGTKKTIPEQKRKGLFRDCPYMMMLFLRTPQSSEYAGTG